MASITVRWKAPDGTAQVLWPKQTLANGSVLRIAKVTDDLEIHAAEQEVFKEPLPLRSGFQDFGAVHSFREGTVPLLVQNPNREGLLDDLTVLNRLFPTTGLGKFQIDRKAADQTTDVKMELDARNVRKFGWAVSPMDAEGVFGSGHQAQQLIQLEAPFPFFRLQNALARTAQTYSIVAGAPVSHTLVNLGDEPCGAMLGLGTGQTGSQLIVVNNTTGRGFTLTAPLTSALFIDFYCTNPLQFRAYRISGGANLMPYLDIAAWLELVPGPNDVEMGGVGTFDCFIQWREAYSSI